ncbi:MAG: Rad52/Rad22 family DNA repair protein [Methylococcaceae bacterium]
MKEDAEYLKTILPQLAEKMDYKWRVQSFNKNKPEATCVAYIDARDVMERLDSVCIYGWDRDHKEIKNHLYAGIGIQLPSGRISWRWDCGTESNQDAEKGEASDSFKRAAVNTGVGRFLYDLKIQRLPANEVKKQGSYPYVVDNRNKRVWDLTAHINGGKKASKPVKEEEPITIETLITFILACKTVNSLNDYYDENEDFIKSLMEPEQDEVMEAFRTHKKELEGK